MHSHDLIHPGDGVTLANWQSDANVQWSFQHVDEIVPTTTIAASPAPAALTAFPVPVGDVPVTLADEQTVTAGWVMDSTDTDGWAVWRGGQLVAEHYPRGMQPGTRHLLMSVSKSLVGMTAGILAHRGVLDVHRTLETYIPALAGRGYGGATVRDLLDMRSGIRFSEEYLDPTAEVRVLEQVIGWAPRTIADLPTTMYDFLASLEAKGPHGGPFEYRSGETDMLGWVLEAAAGAPLPGMLSELLWQPMGAEFDAYIGVDSVGAGMYDGGVCATLRDLIRFGVLLLQDGVSAHGTPVIPPAWIADTWQGGPDSSEAFAASPSITLMPGGRYRNQCWFPDASGDVLLCLGIHGQMIYVNRVTGVVAAKLSSWAMPQDAWKLFSTLRSFSAISASLAA